MEGVFAATESERAFEQYLTQQKLQWTRLPETDRPQPDYAVKHERVRCLFEVKEFDIPTIQPTGGFDPSPAVREKIHRARRKFGEYKDHPCAVVLWSSKSILRTLIPPFVMAAAFGNVIDFGDGFEGDIGDEPLCYAFSGPAALTPSANTTLSAIVILSSYQLDQVWVEAWRRLSEKIQKGEPTQLSDQFNLTQQVAENFVGSRYLFQGSLRTILLENPYARLPFPPDLFMGPFDQRWHLESGRYRLCFMGSELTRLKESGVPFVYL